jgi:hypothetical protein
MKKIFITTAMIALLGTSVFAKDGGKKLEKTVSVSYNVQNQFDADFSDATNVTWSVTPNCQKAIFTLNDVKMTAFYNLQGEFLGTTQDVNYSTLTSKAKKQITDKYKDYTVADVIKYDVNETNTNVDQTVYFVDLKNTTSEILVRVTPSAEVYFFKQVK